MEGSEGDKEASLFSLSMVAASGHAVDDLGCAHPSMTSNSAYAVNQYDNFQRGESALNSTALSPVHGTAKATKLSMAGVEKQKL